MLEQIITFICFVSLFGLLFILYLKIPVLLELPETSIKDKDKAILRFKKQLKKIKPLSHFSYEKWLARVLFKIRILTLKTDNKTFNWLQKLNQKSQKKKLNDNYWQEIKKMKR